MTDDITAPDHQNLPFRMPEALSAQGLAVRPRGADDTDFLRDLYISFRWAELANATDWPEEARRAFLADQFRLQDHHYTTHYLTTAFLIVTLHGAPVGRLYIDHGPDEIRLVDIVLSPEHIGRGWGTAMIRVLMDEADQTGRCVSLHVESNNPARRLYRRLGFTDRKLHGPYVFMTWGHYTGETDLSDGQLNTI
ncbi:GNAT family N-acetyltransferase [Tistrella bauzanensis]|jgi:ribosomal protein S18 acetylase RimI-like enzyme|uniref:GNAT family N-acetyltransferase n=1 Tax=Tistrella arctica TaxID=3133430 RepID=A0ABU9YKA2_9PROT